MSRVAIIPARGGSTRLKNKNIRLISGKPLISYIIETVIASKLFDKIFISTDCDKIAQVASSYKEIEIYHRDPKYATEKITVLEAIIAMMSDLERTDVLAYFLPTCPFLSVDEIKRGTDLLTPEIDSVISVIEYNFPIQLAMIKHDDDMIPVFDNLNAGLTNSKFIQRHFHPTGAFYISWWDKLIRNKNFFVGNIRGVEMSKENYVDINLPLNIVEVEKREVV